MSLNCRIINRRTIFKESLAGLAGAGIAPLLLPEYGRAQTAPHAEIPGNLEITKGPFQGTRKSLAEYQAPEWFRDAKFGIWAHWGPQSAIEAGDWYARNMYLQGKKQYNYHVQTYGHPSKFGFKDTIPLWKAERFDPTHLMQLYKKAGAKYFMSMGVHHDNFDMWDSKHNPWNVVSMGPKRDVVGAWRDAAHSAGLKFGVSEHLWIAYKWFSVSHGSDLNGPREGVPYDGANPKNQSLYIESDQVWRNLDWNESGIPIWWKRHWYSRMRDLLDHYEPDFLYSDGPLPFEDYGLAIVAHLYNMKARGGGATEGVYFSKRNEDSEKGTCVYDRERAILDDILPRPWQTDTCIGDWHYLRGADYKTGKTVIDMLVDIVSKNGNLMMNFPLPASGMLDSQELTVLDELASWIAVNGEGIYGTRPWKISGEGEPVSSADAKSAQFNEKGRRDLNATDVRFTTKGKDLFAFVMGWPDYAAEIRSLAPGTALQVGKIQNVELVGSDATIEWKQSPSGLKIAVPNAPAPTRHASLFRIRGALA